VSISDPDPNSIIRFYKVKLYDQPHYSYFVSYSGKKLQENNFTEDVVGLLVPQEELLEAQKELQETKKALEVTIYNSNIFQKDLSVAIQRRDGLLKELKESKVDRDYFQGELKEAIKQRNGFSAIHGETIKKHQETQKELRETKQKNDGLIKQLEATSQELGQLKIEYTLTCRKCTSTLGEQIQKEVDLNNLVTHLKSAIEVLSNELRETKKENKLLKETYSNRIEGDIQTRNDSHDLITNLRSTISYLEGTKRSLLKELEETKSELLGTEKCINEGNIIINKMIQENKKVTAELEATNQELKVTKISREAAFSKVEELTRTINFLREKYGFLQFP
jgi:hypothetical protein